MAKLDLKRLRADIAKHENEKASAPAARRLTGAMAIVRDNLAEIEALNAAGKSWAAIAAALAQQGVTQGENQPITARRLTALIASVKREATRQEAKLESRAQRRDLSPTKSSEQTRTARRLAPELTRQRSDTPPVATMTEEEIRRANFDKHSALFRKG